MSWDTLKAAVEAVITENGNNEITGGGLRGLLNENLIPQLGDSLFKGKAEPTTLPGIPEKKEIYLASTDGVYANFGGIVLENETCFISYNLSVWEKIVIYKEKIKNTEFNPLDEVNAYSGEKTADYIESLKADEIAIGNEGFAISGGVFNAIAIEEKTRSNQVESIGLLELKEIEIGALESGFYRESGAIGSSDLFERTQDLIDITNYSAILFTGEAGGVSPCAVVFYNEDENVVGFEKLGDTSVIYSSYLFKKIATAKYAHFTFKNTDTVPYKIEGYANSLENFMPRGENIEIETESGYYNNSGVKTTSSSWQRSINAIPLDSDFENYMLKVSLSGSNVSLVFQDKNDDLLSFQTYTTLALTENITYLNLGDIAPENTTSILISSSSSVSPVLIHYTDSLDIAKKSELESVEIELQTQQEILDSYKVENENVIGEIEFGYYDNDGNQQSSSSWYRTVNKVLLSEFLDKYDLYVSLTGGNGSIIFYDESEVLISFETQESLGGVGGQTLKLGDIAPENTKYVNVSSYNSAYPTLIYDYTYYDIAKQSDLDAILEENTPTDDYNIPKGFTMDNALLLQNDNRKNPSHIPLGSFSWWCYPNFLHLNNVDALPNHTNQLLSWVHTTGEQFLTSIYSNVADDRKVIYNKCVSPKIRFAPDEHNVPAFMPLSNGKIIVVSSGHYNTEYLEVRILENLKDDTEVIQLPTQGACTYQQIATYNNKIVIFTRDASYRWSYFYSLDNGITWSDASTFLLGVDGQRAYMRIMRCEEEFLKVYWYPSASERDSYVRYCEINLDTGEILTKYNGTNIGNIFSETAPEIDLATGGLEVFSNALIPDPIDISKKKRIRLLDVSGNLREEAVFLIATLEGESATDDMNGDYRLIEVDLSTMSETSTTLTEYGKEFYNSGSDYMGGASFEQSIYGERTNDIYLSKFGTQNTIYNSLDVGNKFRVEKYVNNVFSELIEESDTQMYRPYAPQYLSLPTVSYKIEMVYHKGDYVSFGNFYTDIIIK